MMGGMNNPIQTTKVVSLEQIRKENFDNMRKVQTELAAKASDEQHKKVEPWEVKVEDVQTEMNKRDEALLNDVKAMIARETGKASSAIADDDVKKDKRYFSKAFGMQETEAISLLRAALQPLPDNAQQPVKLDGYTKIDFTDKNNPVLGYAMRKPADPTQPATEPEFISVGEFFGNPENQLKTFNIHYKTTPVSQPNQPAQPAREDEIWIGPISQKDYDEQMKRVKSVGGVEVKELGSEPVTLYANANGDVAAIVSGNVSAPERKLMAQGLPSFYKRPVSEVKEMAAKQATDINAPMPPQASVSLGIEQHVPVGWWLFVIAIIFGIFMAFAIERLTDYYVSLHGRPVKEVAGVSSAGPAPMIIQGFALAAESSVFSVFAIVIALLVPLYIFSPAVFGSPILSFYGIALVGLGLLTTTGYILAMDTFGPISDNAQGVFEMSGAGHDNPVGAKAVQRLDAAGNTTKALTKGFAIATAVVAAVALFHSYIESAQLTTTGLRLEVPEIFLGLLIGGAAPFLFSAFAINAVGRASFDLINEVRRQFKADPGIMKGTSKPDYGKCVAIVTEAAQKELLGPGILAIALPLAVAFGFSIGKEPVMINGVAYNLAGAQALGGFLAGAILSGQLMAVLLANSGGIWDNAKKLIEDGMYGGKGSEAHKAGVVCDTVGDPFKDTAGPALNPLIKVMNLVSLLLAPKLIQPMSNTVLTIALVICLAALSFSIWWSKRSSMSTALSSVAGTDAAPSAIEAPKPRKRLTVEEEPETENEA
ncbi:MAG: sodium/proton-translocating pyrophosphatase [Armatimonadetes bacterium]|nr:sodium/proton-translocating pyrophosphatase [Armatimonadota bacterium]